MLDGYEIYFDAAIIERQILSTLVWKINAAFEREENFKSDSICKGLQ